MELNKLMDDVQQEPGWEFTLPMWLVKPCNWILAIFVIIALVLSVILFNKMHAANSTSSKSLPSKQQTNSK